MANVFVRSNSKLPLQIIENNKKEFGFFRIVGLFPITYEDGKFLLHDKTCVLIRMLWFIWHLAGIITMLYIRYRALKNQCEDLSKNATESIKSPDDEKSPDVATNKCESSLDQGDFNIYLIIAAGVLFYILVDPVQTNILKRTLMVMPKILKEVQHLENIDLGDNSSKKFIVSCKYLIKKSKKKRVSTGSTVNICMDDEIDTSKDQYENSNTNNANQDETEEMSKYYTALRYIIVGLSFLIFLLAFIMGCYDALRPRNGLRHDIKDEWKFFGCLFYLVFPSITTWFCVFFIGYQRKMYNVLNELPDNLFLTDDHIKAIGDYLQTMQNISTMLVDRIYKFTFGVNFAIYVLIGTASTFELIQGAGEINQGKNKEFGDVIYLYIVAVCVFNLFLSCQANNNLMHGQRDKLKKKLNNIMTPLMVDKLEIVKENEKKFKRVEVLYKSLKDFSPQAEVYGGFKVDYKMFTAMLLFMFSYARVFYKYNPAKIGAKDY